MKYFIFLTFALLAACQTFEAGRPAAINECPEGHINNGSGLCRPVNTLNSQQLAREQQRQRAALAASATSPQVQQETRTMIVKIDNSNSSRRSSEAPTEAGTSAKNQSAVTSLNDRSLARGVQQPSRSEYQAVIGEH
jgi:hypothetical protein